MLINLKKREIPIILLNGRITKKTYEKWLLFSNFAQTLFDKFNLCLCSNNETKKYLKKLGAKKVKYIGNLKYAQSEQKIDNINKNVKSLIRSKKVWCASSTHFNEKIFVG